MTFTLIDVVLIVIVVVFISVGYVLGLVHTLGSFIGAVLGVYVASHTAIPLGNWLAPHLGGNTQVVTIIAFSVIYLLASRLFGLVFYLLEKSVGTVAKLPFLKSIDHMLGGVFGFLEGVIAVGAFVYFAGAILPVDWIENLIKNSQVGAWLLGAFGYLSALVPEAIRTAISKAIGS